MDLLNDVARRELEQGETILWSGHPDPGAQALQYLKYPLFVIAWAAASLCVRNGAPFVFGAPAADLLPIAAVIIAAASPFWAAYRARRTTYAITSKRILIIRQTPDKSVLSYHAADIGELKRTERSDGSGTLAFSQQVGYNPNKLIAVPNEQLVGIPNVRHVEQIIRETFKIPTDESTLSNPKAQDEESYWNN